jgi:hypothetical protein
MKNLQPDLSAKIRRLVRHWDGAYKLSANLALNRTFPAVLGFVSITVQRIGYNKQHDH